MRVGGAGAEAHGGLGGDVCCFSSSAEALPLHERKTNQTGGERRG